MTQKLGVTRTETSSILPINTAIACTDGPCGHSTAIILNPVSNQVTHLVVREPRLFDTERMVPVEFVTESTPELIRLRCTEDELVHLPPFVTTGFFPPPPSFTRLGWGRCLLWPYVDMEPEFGMTGEYCLRRIGNPSWRAGAYDGRAYRRGGGVCDQPSTSATGYPYRPA